MKSTEDKKLSYSVFDREHVTVAFIKQILMELRPNYHIVSESDRVTNIEHIIKEKAPDFIISDISLSDGLSTSEFSRLGCRIPTVIFTADSELLPSIEGLNVVYCALKPISKENINISLLQLENKLHNF